MSKFAESGTHRAAVLLWFVCMLLACGNAQAATLQGLRISESDAATRVVLDLSAPLRHKLSTLQGPHRVVLDLPDAAIGAGFSEAVAANRKRIRNLRVGRRDGGYRLVFDTVAATTPVAFAVAPKAPYGHRLVIDFRDAGKAVAAAAPSAAPAAVSKAATPRPRPVQPLPHRNVVVAIDPGHGGNDPGAIGPGKVREKDVVLAISRKLAALINKEPGFEAVLIRTGDYYVNLRERVRQARAKRADLFVSIHADAFTSPKVTGASVYTLSESGASSEAARWLAAKENKSDLIGGVGKVSLRDKDDLLAEVLIDMSNHANRSLSLQAGGAVLSELGAMTDLHKAQVQKAGFMVLKAPDVPSILVETGYISNPVEARRLANARYQNKLANAVAKGVVRYLKEAPPPGTLLASNFKPAGTSYTIRRGDTLSALAARYGIATRRIREANDLRNDAIMVGQTLIIPAG